MLVLFKRCTWTVTRQAHKLQHSMLYVIFKLNVKSDESFLWNKCRCGQCAGRRGMNSLWGRHGAGFTFLYRGCEHKLCSYLTSGTRIWCDQGVEEIFRKGGFAELCRILGSVCGLPARVSQAWAVLNFVFVNVNLGQDRVLELFFHYHLWVLCKEDPKGEKIRASRQQGLAALCKHFLKDILRAR